MNSSAQRLAPRWTIVLALDTVTTSLTALVSVGIGLLLPGITENYDASLADSIPYFALAAFLLLSLAVTASVVRNRVGGRNSDKAVRVCLSLSAVRLGLIVCGFLVYVVYGALTYGF
ncbi:hypothetical protein ABT063_35080 [Streptomyces sp. NPDC002838]|uniref:hypothetical protein n=1 Tax=Streptomyces sp. NPDC002838 TaxID=3154436 RepID=UPI00331E6196